MDKIITFQNNTGKSIEVYIEPAAELFTLLPEVKAVFKISYLENIEIDPLDIEFDNESISIYEGQGMLLKVFIGEELMYYTDYSP